MIIQIMITIDSKKKVLCRSSSCMTISYNWFIVIVFPTHLQGFSCSSSIRKHESSTAASYIPCVWSLQQTALFIVVRTGLSFSCDQSKNILLTSVAENSFKHFLRSYEQDEKYYRYYLVVK